MDLTIEIGLPDQISRESILKLSFSKSHVPVDKDVFENIPFIARSLDNKSGADIVNICRNIVELSEMPEDENFECWVTDAQVTMHHVTMVLNRISEYIDF